MNCTEHPNPDVPHETYSFACVEQMIKEELEKPEHEQFNEGVWNAKADSN